MINSKRIALNKYSNCHCITIILPRSLFKHVQLSISFTVIQPNIYNEYG